MGKFITTLKVEQISEATTHKNAKWRLIEPLIYESKNIGLVIVDKGTVTDFASVPRLPISFLFAGGRSNAPAALHDHLYAERRVSRLKADNLIFEAIIDSSPNDKMLAYSLAIVTWLGVRLFGWIYWK